MDKKWEKALAVACGVAVMLPNVLGAVPAANAKMPTEEQKRELAKHQPKELIFDDRFPWGKEKLVEGTVFWELKKTSVYAPYLREPISKLDNVISAAGGSILDNYERLFYILRGNNQKGVRTLITKETMEENQGVTVLGQSFAGDTLMRLLDEIARRNPQIAEPCKDLCFAIGPRNEIYGSMSEVSQTLPELRNFAFKQITAEDMIIHMRPMRNPADNPLQRRILRDAVVVNENDFLLQFSIDTLQVAINKWSREIEEAKKASKPLDQLEQKIKQAKARQEGYRSGQSPLYTNFMSWQKSEGYRGYVQYVEKKYPLQKNKKRIFSDLFMGNINGSMLSRLNFDKLPPNGVAIDKVSFADYSKNGDAAFSRHVDSQAGAAILETQEVTVFGKKVVCPKYNDAFLDRLVNYEEYRKKALIGVIDSLWGIAEAGIELNIPKYELKKHPFQLGGDDINILSKVPQTQQLLAVTPAASGVGPKAASTLIKTSEPSYAQAFVAHTTTTGKPAARR
jgi:hypothetical protein